MTTNTTLLGGFIFDTSTVIDLGRRIFPTQLRESANDVVDGLIGQGRITIPMEVYKELKKNERPGDEVVAWCEMRMHLFTEMTDEQQALLADTLTAYPSLVKLGVETFDADPIIIAMGRDLGWTVVTSDGANANDNIVKVHPVCRAYNVRCLNEYDFLRENGWSI